MLPYVTVIQKRSQSSHKSSFIVLNHGEHGTITASTSTSRLHRTSAENPCQAQHLRQRLHICRLHCRLQLGSFRVSYFLFGKCPFSVASTASTVSTISCYSYRDIVLVPAVPSFQASNQIQQICGMRVTTVTTVTTSNAHRLQPCLWRG